MSRIIRNELFIDLPSFDCVTQVLDASYTFSTASPFLDREHWNVVGIGKKSQEIERVLRMSCSVSYEWLKAMYTSTIAT